MSKTVLSVLWLAFVNVLGLTQLSAQQSTGTIVGTVTDKSQAILPGATVKLALSGVSATSNGQGQFTITNVAPGSYTLTVDYVGFTPGTTNVTVVAGQVARATVVMNVASETESIIVTAERAHGEAESINEETVAGHVFIVVPWTMLIAVPTS